MHPNSQTPVLDRTDRIGEERCELKVGFLGLLPCPVPKVPFVEMSYREEAPSVLDRVLLQPLPSHVRHKKSAITYSLHLFCMACNPEDPKVALLHSCRAEPKNPCKWSSMPA